MYGNPDFLIISVIVFYAVPISLPGFSFHFRREWDLFLVPPSTGGSRIPEGWVMPAEPSSGTWASVLKDRQILT